jgi:O-acetyl-ADP-ribose deacetylase (regulator of RNase III)
LGVQFSINGLSIELIQGDITELETDAIVNAASGSLILGAGVGGAIRRKGGSVIQEECNKIGSCAVGQAVITSGGNLKARYVIHAVGPRMGDGSESAKLAGTVKAALSLAEGSKLSSVALPAISVGTFGLPLDTCARVMAKEVLDFSFEQRHHLHRVVVCLVGNAAYQKFAEAFLEELSGLDDAAMDHTLLLDPRR